MATTNRRRLSNQERGERRAADRERLHQAAQQLLTSDGWQRWVHVRARGGLARLSLNNQLLVALSCPDATFVAAVQGMACTRVLRAQGRDRDSHHRPMPIKNRDDDRQSDEDAQPRLLIKAISVFYTLSRDCRDRVVPTA